ncbi:MAG: hypothetical protein OXC31_29415 [Spirochaetaceae bacterium]|nr:hypothetical protein [Spirochaetaceae bacterium]
MKNSGRSETHIEEEYRWTARFDDQVLYEGTDLNRAAEVLRMHARLMRAIAMGLHEIDVFAAECIVHMDGG